MVYRWNVTGLTVGASWLSGGASPVDRLQDSHIVSTLKKYSHGLRGAGKEGLDGTKMLCITNQMIDASFIDLSAHLAELADKYAEKPPWRYLWGKR